MFRQVSLPFHDDNKIRKTLAFELEPLIPLAIDEVVADYLTIPRDGLLVAALTKKIIRDWIEKVEGNLGECIDHRYFFHCPGRADTGRKNISRLRSHSGYRRKLNRRVLL